VASSQVLEFSSVVYQPSCFFLDPFHWGKVSDPSAGSLLLACYAILLINFQFCNDVWLWMLLTGSGDDLCGSLSALFQEAVYHPPTTGPSSFPVFVYWKFPCRSAPCASPLLRCT
jgi:hypothetical protein